MRKLNRGILSEADFFGVFYPLGILTTGDFILQAIFCGGFYPRGIFPDTEPWSRYPKINNSLFRILLIIFNSVIEIR